MTLARLEPIHAPWRDEPHRLWSLLDMLRIYAPKLLGSIARLSRAVVYLQYHKTPEEHDKAIGGLEEALDACAEELAVLPLSNVVKDFLARVRNRVVAKRDDTSALTAIVVEFHNSLMTELDEQLLLFVPGHRKDLYVGPEAWYGDEVSKAFPTAVRDFRDACQCFALGQWTASVFHAMRVAEHGLRAMASDLTVTFPAGIDLENWKNVIDGIEKAIRALEAQPKSQRKSDDLQHYSDAAVQLRYFKDAWRNHVSHSKSEYDEQGARKVLNAVKYFMEALTQRPPLP